MVLGVYLILIVSSTYYRSLPFTISEPQNQEIGKINVVQENVPGPILKQQSCERVGRAVFQVDAEGKTIRRIYKLWQETSMCSG